MPVRSPKNEYRGVNAHLHSHFQNAGGWDGFHTAHITDLARAIARALPEGYSVELEQSLQLREFHPDTSERLRRPQPDMTIFQRERGSMPAAAGNLAATLIQPVIETIDLREDQYYAAAVIYQSVDDAALGRPITRIELLSPSNKRGDGYLTYIEKRSAALRSGLRLVEIDYLHETPSPIKGVPRYPGDPGAFPYTLSVSDPRPDLATGLTHTYGFSVDQPIPQPPIPLENNDAFEIDVDAVYQFTFAGLPTFSARVDYEQLPASFDRYRAADQDRIRLVMARVMAH